MLVVIEIATVVISWEILKVGYRWWSSRPTKRDLALIWDYQRRTETPWEKLC